MIARAALSYFALLAIVVCPARAQSPLWVDVSPNTEDPGEVEKRYTPELVEELALAKDDAMLLYTEYTARSATDTKMFIRNISGLFNETIKGLDWSHFNNAPEPCRSKFEQRLKKIVFNAQRAASFSGENHHKFLLGHMIVFRMHLNKSEDYIKKCDKVIQGCGILCETTPKITRWRRLAAQELHRVRDDLQHSRRSYRDLIAHAFRRLKTLRRRAIDKAQDAIEEFQQCATAG